MRIESYQQLDLSSFSRPSVFLIETTTCQMHQDLPTRQKMKSNLLERTETSGKKHLINKDVTAQMLLRMLKQAKLNSYWISAPVSTLNRFSALDNSKPMEKENTNNTTIARNRNIKPLPIFINKVTNNH